MTTEVENQEKPHAPLNASRRPLGALLMCEAVAELADDAGAERKGDGRWALNTGAQMITYVWGVNCDDCGWPRPMRLVLDLAKAKFEKPVISALYAHSDWAIVGQWTGGTVDLKKIAADLTIYRDLSAAEAAVLPDAVRVGALLDRDHPWQASVGCYPKDGIDGYELVKAGKTVTVNGTEFQGDGDLPLFIMRKPVIYEASVVLWGADGNTGKLAASLLNPLAHLAQLRSSTPNPDKGTATMSTPAPASAAPTAGARLKALLARFTDETVHGLVVKLMADDKNDDEIRDAVHAAQLKVRDDKITDLTAKLAEAVKPPVTTSPGKTGKTEASAKDAPAFGAGSDTASEAPKSISEAVKLLRADHKDATAAKLTSMAYQKWPELTRPEIKIGKG